MPEDVGHVLSLTTKWLKSNDEELFKEFETKLQYTSDEYIYVNIIKRLIHWPSLLIMQRFNFNVDFFADYKYFQLFNPCGIPR